MIKELLMLERENSTQQDKLTILYNVINIHILPVSQQLHQLPSLNNKIQNRPKHPLQSLIPIQIPITSYLRLPHISKRVIIKTLNQEL